MSSTSDFGHEFGDLLSQDVTGVGEWGLETYAPDPRLESRFTQPGPSFLRDNVIATRRLEQVDVKKRRMENLMELIRDESELPPEREPRFFNDQITKRAGLVFIKPLYDDDKELYYIHFMKLATGESDRESVFMKIAYSECANFIDVLKKQLKEIDRNKISGTLPRLEKSAYSSTTDYTDPRFWHKDHTDYLESGRLAIRPHRHPDGYFTIKILQPKRNNSEMNRSWLGR